MTNWLMELTKLSKTDKTALELLRQLKSASTEEEKEKAKENGKAYIENIQENIQAQVSAPEAPSADIPTETPDSPEEDVEETPDVSMAEPESVVGDNDVAPSEPVQTKVVEKKYDMSEPAFNPRLAKMGITREEELFKMGVLVRKMTREEKILIRRSIYQKKKQYMAATQERFKKQQAEARAAKEADPQYQKYMHQQKMVIKIEEALKNHYNMEWMFRNIDDLTPDVLRELIEVPANANRFKTQKEEFVKNFYKKYGK